MAMIAKEIIMFFVLIFVTSQLSSVVCLNLERLQNECVRGRPLEGTVKLECVASEVTIQMAKEGNQTFYCIIYEKNSGDILKFDVLSLGLLEDYDLKYTGSNLISNVTLYPKFKLYDTRSRRSYKGKFGIRSQNHKFDIRSLFINGEEQICYDNNINIWPSPPKYKSNVQHPIRPSSRRSSCGQIMEIINYEGFLVIPSSPGQNPWMVLIYRYFGEAGEIHHQCAGTIIDKRTILTSVNCLLEDGRLLNPAELKVYVAPFQLSAAIANRSLYNVSNVHTHKSYNLNLENNIAALKLSQDIVFNDYVQPICLPEHAYSVKGKVGKFAGFGKTSSLFPAENDLLNSEQFTIGTVKTQTFEAESISGKSQTADMGGGLYVKEEDRWILVGIMSKNIHIFPMETPIQPQTFTFSNIPKYISWIQSLNRDLNDQDQESDDY